MCGPDIWADWKPEQVNTIQPISQVCPVQLSLLAQRLLLVHPLSNIFSEQISTRLRLLPFYSPNMLPRVYTGHSGPKVPRSPLGRRGAFGPEGPKHPSPYRRGLVPLLRPNGLSRWTSPQEGVSPPRESEDRNDPTLPLSFRQPIVVVRPGRADLLQMDVKKACAFLTSWFHEEVGLGQGDWAGWGQLFGLWKASWGCKASQPLISFNSHLKPIPPFNKAKFSYIIKERIKSYLTAKRPICC